jgi:hypothetical protein
MLNPAGRSTLWRKWVVDGVLGPTAFEQPGSEDLGATKHSDYYACP